MQTRATGPGHCSEVTVTSELYAQALDAIYQGFADPDGITDTLGSIRTLIGAEGATLEVIDTTTSRPLVFHSSGVASAEGDDYLAHFAPRNPRLAVAARQRRGELCWDYQVMDERAMSRDPFYAEFLPRAGLRYFVSAVIEHTPRQFVALTLQRARRQGHVGSAEIAQLRRLTPHLQRAYDWRRRFGAASGEFDTRALDLLTDGVALLGAKGQVVYLNPSLQAMSAEGGLLRIDQRGIHFRSGDVSRRFARALGAVAGIGNLAGEETAIDFLAPRTDGLPPCTISLRALPRVRLRSDLPDAAAIMLVRDPLTDRAAARLLQELHGLTRAEAQLACALSGGMTAVEYAAHRGVKVTTVYTHLKRTREKTGWRGVAELTRRVQEISIGLRMN